VAAKGFSVPPPVGGLNARDELANMDERDAVLMDNFFPEPTYVRLRGGYSSYATGMGAFPVRTLMEWSGPGSRELKAVCNGSIYDVTAPGPVASAEVSSLTNSDWQWTNFSTAGGDFIVACNGADDVLNYDGSAWSEPVISGVTSANLIYPCIHKGRLWFVENNTTNAWYLPSASIAGAASKQALGQFYRLGGKLVAIGSLSRDSGDGVDDYLAFLSSRGEVAIYQGTDPNSIDTWALVGVYYIGYPIGGRPMIKIGGDQAVITSDGVVSLMKMMELDRAAADRAEITNKIQNLFNRAVLAYQGNFGWQGTVYPQGTQVLINIPVNTQQYEQYVMNTITGSWCRYTNMNAVTWGLMGDDLYFGDANGTVYLADSGFQDNGGVISGQFRTAWNYFKSRGRNKLFQLYRPIVQTNGTPSVSLAMNTDFQAMDPSTAAAIGGVNQSLWGVDSWGTATWSGDGAVTALWEAAGNIGYCGAIVLKVQSNGQSFIVNSFDVQASWGGAL